MDTWGDRDADVRTTQHLKITITLCNMCIPDFKNWNYLFCLRKRSSSPPNAPVHHCNLDSLHSTLLDWEDHKCSSHAQMLDWANLYCSVATAIIGMYTVCICLKEIMQYFPMHFHCLCGDVISITFLQNVKANKARICITYVVINESRKRVRYIAYVQLRNTLCHIINNLISTVFGLHAVAPVVFAVEED